MAILGLLTQVMPAPDENTLAPPSGENTGFFNLENIADVVENYHFNPKVLDDGLSHHFYHEDLEVVSPAMKASNIVEFFKDFHFVPREAQDGKYHFWYAKSAEVQEKTSPMDVVTIYRSDISNVPLEFGKFYHKLGFSFDISDKEYALLSPEEKEKYVRIDSANDIMHLMRDWGHKAVDVKKEEERKKGIPVVKYRSDISQTPLEFGKFFHKVGSAFDLTEAEFERLPRKDQEQYVRIDGIEDLQKYSEDWAVNINKNTDNNAGDPRSKPAVSKVALHATSPLHLLHKSVAQTPVSPNSGMNPAASTAA